MPAGDTSQVYQKMKFNIELLKPKSFWPAENQNETLQPLKYITQLFLFLQRIYLPQKYILIFSWTRRPVPCTSMVSVCIFQGQRSKVCVALHKISRTQVTRTAGSALTTSIFGIFGCAEVILVNLLCLGC